MVNVGLVIGPSTPRARAAPRTNVVLPAPSTPDTSTTSPGVRRRESRAPAASVSAGPAVSKTSGKRPAHADPQAGAGEDEARAQQRDQRRIAPGAGKLATRRARLRRLLLTAALGSRGGQLAVAASSSARAGAGAGLSALLTLERVPVLGLARALRERAGG